MLNAGWILYRAMFRKTLALSMPKSAPNCKGALAKQGGDLARMMHGSWHLQSARVPRLWLAIGKLSVTLVAGTTNLTHPEIGQREVGLFGVADNSFGTASKRFSQRVLKFEFARQKA